MQSKYNNVANAASPSLRLDVRTYRYKRKDLQGRHTTNPEFLVISTSLATEQSQPANEDSLKLLTARKRTWS
ncbi:hypothetical protein EYF80_028424 [Liparis tanakae]|uniref:Uncharacterized protein n=1 Tax=Liparis tanakae TaxID=230148 RepID=A0A4Z2H688_9TELE|nr:hypothetical protein EYF80_028424 [Liparis tanakae]